MTRFQEFKAIQKHRKEVQRIAKEKGYSFPFHDLVKAILVLLIGDHLATKLHRKYSRHHEQNGDIKNKIEAAIDWESARFTKPDKQLNAYETWVKYYKHIPMKDTLWQLDLYDPKKAELKCANCDFNSNFKKRGLANIENAICLTCNKAFIDMSIKEILSCTSGTYDKYSELERQRYIETKNSYLKYLK